MLQGPRKAHHLDRIGSPPEVEQHAPVHPPQSPGRGIQRASAAERQFSELEKTAEVVGIREHVPGEIGVRAELHASAKRANGVLVASLLRVDAAQRDQSVGHVGIERERAPGAGAGALEVLALVIGEVRTLVEDQQAEEGVGMRERWIDRERAIEQLLAAPQVVAQRPHRILDAVKPCLDVEVVGLGRLGNGRCE